MSRTRKTTTTAPPPDEAPAARRLKSTPAWRDPRVIIGLLIVAACVVGGVRVIDSADETVGVWALRADVPAGSRLKADAVEVRRVKFADASTQRGYFLATRSLPDGAIVKHDLTSGELLPKAAVGSAETGKLIELPLAVEPNRVPANLHRGSRVDVWASPDAAAGAPNGKTTRVFENVVVLEIPAQESNFAPDATRQLIIGVSGEVDLTEPVSVLQRGKLLVTGRGA